MTDAVQRYDHTREPVNPDTIDHHCFGCGNGNPHGLRLRFRMMDDLPATGVWADFTPTRDHEGYMGMTHGGILSTIADEAMSWAVTVAGDLGVTARMSLTFRRPARLGETLRVDASITSRKSRTIDTRAEIRSVVSGEIVATAEGRFVRVSREQAASFRDAYGITSDDTVFGAAAQRNSSAGERGTVMQECAAVDRMDATSV